MTIRIYGNQLPNKQTESYKTFRVGPSDDCTKIIIEALNKYKIVAEWTDYILLLAVKENGMKLG